MPQSAAARYAQAFGVSAEWLITGKPQGAMDKDAEQFLPHPDKDFRKNPRRGAGRAANILKALRKDRGFSTATGAARAYGWPLETYRRHETGITPIPIHTARIYAYAYDLPIEVLDVRRESVNVPMATLVGRICRSPEEVRAFAAENGTSDADRGPGTVLLESFTDPNRLLAAAGAGRLRNGFLRPVPTQWLPRHLPHDELAIAEIRSEDATGFATAHVLVHLRASAPSNAEELRVFVNRGGWIVSTANCEAEAERRLEEAGGQEGGPGPMARYPVVAMMMPAGLIIRGGWRSDDALGVAGLSRPAHRSDGRRKIGRKIS